MKKLALAALFLATPAYAGEQVNVALDWTPNTNHVGLYVAEAKGWFDEAGLDVEILPYTDTSSSTLLASGVAQFGIVSSVGLYTQKARGADLKAVYAVTQHETGRLVFNGDREDIQRPKDLDGKIYAGFGTTWEETLIASMIQHDGGEGQFDMVTLGTSAYEALANGRVDFTLEVSTWEGINSELLDRPQPGFAYADYGVPESHTTLLGAQESWLAENEETAKAFVQAAQRGYAFAAANPEEASDILIAETKGLLFNDALVRASMQELVAKNYLVEDGEVAGEFDPDMVTSFGDFMYQAGMLTTGEGDALAQKPDFNQWVSNDYLAK